MIAILCLILCICLAGCGLRPLFRYSKLQMRFFISMIITDRFTDLKKVGYEKGVDILEGGENVWEVSLPDRGGVKVRFYNGIDDFAGNDMGSHDWHRYIKTDYVGAVIAATDPAGKDEIDERYGMLAGTTEVEYDKYGTVKVYVHTKQGLEDLSEDDLTDYVEDCMEYYDLGVQPAGTYKEGSYYGVEQLVFVIVHDDVKDAATGKPFEDDLIPVQGTLSDYKLLGEGEKFQKDYVRSLHRQNVARYKHDNDLEKKITDEQALSVIKEYCLTENPDLEDVINSGEYDAYWNVEASTEYEVVVLFRSYTGAQIRYYVDRITGKTRITEEVPGITEGEEQRDEELNVWDMLPASEDSR